MERTKEDHPDPHPPDLGKEVLELQKIQVRVTSMTNACKSFFKLLYKEQKNEG